MKLVVIESPYSGDVGENIKYARAALLDSLKRGEAPIASHLLYTQVLDDAVSGERALGIDAGFAWNKHAELVAVYTDRGISDGMTAGILFAADNKIPVEFRSIDDT